jgi:hypothetical protein
MVIILFQTDFLIALFCWTFYHQGIQDAQKGFHRTLQVSWEAWISARGTIAAYDFEASENADPAKYMLTAGLHRVSQNVLTNLARDRLHKVCWEVHCQKLGTEMYLIAVSNLLHDFLAADTCLSSSLVLTDLLRSVKHNFDFFAELHICLMSLPLESLLGSVADVTGWRVWAPFHGCIPWEVNLTWGTAKLPIHDAPAVMAEFSGVD